MIYWMNLPLEYRKGKFVILPLPYENNPTYGKGADKGPEEIIKASHHLEYYDEQFEVEPFLEGIEQTEIIGQGKFVIGLGGDHSVTLKLTKNLKEDVSVIILDAHPDMFYSWNGSTNNHRCVSQKIGEKHSLLQIGIRSMDIDEKKIIEQNPQVNIIKAYEYTKEDLLKKLKLLKNKIYLSIDVDVFEFITNTGTPEPGGFTWNQTMEILQVIFENKEVIGADIVEFAPLVNFRKEAYSLAKLAYKLMALKCVQGL